MEILSKLVRDLVSKNDKGLRKAMEQLRTSPDKAVVVESDQKDRPPIVLRRVEPS